MHARSADTTQQSSQDLQHNPTAPNEPIKKRAGLVVLRRDRSALGAACVTGENRRRMIERAAYYRAERRGFVPGYELQDWLDAERELNANLSDSKTIPPESLGHAGR